jgi:hypothetical protein
MSILYAVGLVLALLAGGTIALLLRTGYYARIGSERGECEKDLVESREFYATVTQIRPVRAVNPQDDHPSAA